MFGGSVPPKPGNTVNSQTTPTRVALGNPYIRYLGPQPPKEIKQWLPKWPVEFLEAPNG